MTSICRQAALFGLLCVVAAGLAGADPIDRYLPGDTLAHLKLSDGKKLQDQLNKTNIHKFLEEPEIKRLIDEISENLGDDFAEYEDQLGYKLSDLLSLFDGGGASLTLTGLALTAKNPVIDRLLFSVETGGYTKKWRKLRDTLFDTIKENNEAAKVTKYSLKQCEVTALRVAGITLSTAFYKGRYFASTDVTALIQLIGRIESGDTKDSLADNAKYKKLEKQTTRGRPGLFLYVDTEEMMKQVFGGVAKAAEAKDAINKLGIDQIKAVGVSSCVTDKGFVETIQIHAPNAVRGVFSLVDGLPTGGDQRMMKLAPAKSLLTVTGSVEPLQSWLDYYALIRDVDRDTYESIQKDLKKFEEAMGGKMTDLLRPLGKRFLFYLTMPPHEGLSPDLVTLWEVSDTKKLQAELDKMIARLTRAGDEEATLDIRKIPFRDGHFHYANLSRLGQQQVIAPSWAIRGNYLVVSHSPNGLKQAWARLEDGGKNLVDTKRYKIMQSQLSPNPGGLVYFDAGRLLTATYETLVSFFQGVIPKGDVPFEPALLPRPALLARYMYGMGLATYKTDNGVRLEFASPIGVVPLVLVAGVGTALQQLNKANNKGAFGVGKTEQTMPKISFKFDDMTLADALDTLSRRAGVAIHFPREMCTQIKVSAQAETITLAEALKQIVPGDQLSHRLRKLPDGRMQVVVYLAAKKNGGPK